MHKADVTDMIDLLKQARELAEELIQKEVDSAMAKQIKADAGLLESTIKQLKKEKKRAKQGFVRGADYLSLKEWADIHQLVLNMSDEFPLAIMNDYSENTITLKGILFNSLYPNMYGRQYTSSEFKMYIEDIVIHRKDCLFKDTCDVNSYINLFGSYNLLNKFIILSLIEVMLQAGKNDSDIKVLREIANTIATTCTIKDVKKLEILKQQTIIDFIYSFCG